MLRAPGLKRLSLGSCLVDVDSGPFHNLQHFSIELKPSGDMLNRLHQTLLQMPNLEKLFLWPELGWTCYFPGVTVPGLQPAVLPNLRFIEFRGWDVEWISAMLEAISPGPERNLYVSPESYRDVDELLSMFTRVMSHATETPIRRLRLSIYPSPLMGLWVKAWRGDLESCYPDIGMATRLCSHEAFMARREVEFDIVGLLSGLLGKMNYQDLQILDLDFAKMLPISTWVRLFGALPSLTTIELRWGERELFGALIDGIGDAPTHSEDTSAAPATLPFQALKETKLGQRSQLYPEEEIDFMLKCLRRRLNLGMGLKKLLFLLPDSESDVKSQVEVFKDVVELSSPHSF